MGSTGWGCVLTYHVRLFHWQELCSEHSLPVAARVWALRTPEVATGCWRIQKHVSGLLLWTTSVCNFPQEKKSYCFLEEWWALTEDQINSEIILSTSAKWLKDEFKWLRLTPFCPFLLSSVWQYMELIQHGCMASRWCWHWDASQ